MGKTNLFNIFICDLISIVGNIDFARYADNTTPYLTGENTKEVIEALENSKNSSKELMQWFSNNQMRGNDDQYHLLTSSNKESTIFIDNNIITSSKCGKLVNVKINQKQNFNAHS